MRLFSRFIPGLLMLSLLVLAGAGCTASDPEAERLAGQRVTLKVWRTFDGQDALNDIMRSYQSLHPNVSFEYRRLRSDEYEQELIKAFARGEGPDIFSIHNTWVGEYRDLITPLPSSITLPYTEVTGTIKKETITELRQLPSITPREIRKQYIDVVASDVVRTGVNSAGNRVEQVYALPLAVDTLALYYNKDLLNAAGIAEPPQTWNQFLEAVEQLTVYGQNDRILQSGAAIGTGRNVDRSFDILSLLMLQNGTAMTNDEGRPNFANNISDGSVPGASATRFYTDFANPIKSVYTWNADQPNSFEAFVTGKTAFMFGYAYHNPQIKARAPKLNYSVTAAPQIENAKVVNYANYWVETVAKASRNQTWAWDFVQFATTRPNQVQTYLNNAKRPTALRGLISSQTENEFLSPFAGQLLTAKSWYRGRDVETAEQAFTTLIDRVRTSDEDLIRLLTDAQNAVSQSY